MGVIRDLITRISKKDRTSSNLIQIDSLDNPSFGVQCIEFLEQTDSTAIRKADFVSLFHMTHDFDLRGRGFESR